MTTTVDGEENAAYLLLILTGQDIGQDKAQWQRWYDEDRKKRKREENERIRGKLSGNNLHVDILGLHLYNYMDSVLYPGY